MRIAAIADQHGLLPEIPECDLLIIAGDVCPVALPHDPATQANWLDIAFRHWLEEAPAEQIVGIAGNHDFVFEARRQPLLPWTYLQDSGCEIEGLRLWGTPWVPNMPNWAFSMDSPGWSAEETFDRIPGATNILISHGPPRQIGDRLTSRDRVGSQELRDVLKRVRPQLTVFGHVHEDRGLWHLYGGTQANVALVDEYYTQGAREPLVFDV